MYATDTCIPQLITLPWTHFINPHWNLKLRKLVWLLFLTTDVVIVGISCHVSSTARDTTVWWVAGKEWATWGTWNTTSTLASSQTRGITHCIGKFEFTRKITFVTRSDKYNMYMYTCNLQAQFVSPSTAICDGSGAVMTHKRQSLLVVTFSTDSGRSASNGSPEPVKWVPPLHSNCICDKRMFVTPDCVALYLTATETALYRSAREPTARQVKWWSSKVISTPCPSPPSEIAKLFTSISISIALGSVHSAWATAGPNRIATTSKSTRLLWFMIIISQLSSRWCSANEHTN